MRILRHLCFLILLPLNLVGQSLSSSNAADVWASKVLSEMTVDEKIGQLFMIRAHSDKGKEHEAQLLNYVKKYKVGGLCFFQGTPEKQARMTNELQKASKYPMLIAIDAEWGLGMRFPKSALSFPHQLTLGAISDNKLIYEMGTEVARQLNRIGVNVNFAPVVDINNNPDNPVINDRSFGEDLYNVGAKSYAYMKGMQEGGLIACAKHFPGHGDTDVDSHFDLPVLPFSRQRLDSLELAPFKMMAELGIKSMMSAHLHVPSIDSRANRPTTLSSTAIDGILRTTLNYDGLVFTDGLEMEGVAKHFKPGVMEVEAILAGNDVLLLPIDLPVAFKALQNAVADGTITKERLNKSVLRILKAKYDVDLTSTPSIPALSEIDADINDLDSKLLKGILTEKSLTLVKNDQNLVPIRLIQDKKFTSLSLGAEEETMFQQRLKSYANVTAYHRGKTISAEDRSALVSQLSSSDIVFVSLHNMSNRSSKQFGISQDQLDLIFALKARTKVVLTIFGSPYSLRYFTDINTTLMAYEDHEIAQDKAAQALFGVFSIEGKLPVTASPTFPYGTQHITSNLQRMGYDIPERVGVNSSMVASIDSLVDVMIKKKAAPGCQILVIKDRTIILNKAYGNHAYSPTEPVLNTDLYDVASVTKVLATTISLMTLVDKNQFDVHLPLKLYLPELDTTNKATIQSDAILAHQARLAGWIPFYKHTQEEDGKSFKAGYFTTASNSQFNIKVCDNLFMCNTFVDSIHSKIYVSELNDTDKYKYSDLGFYLMKDVIERQTGFGLNQYCDMKFYRPMGLSNIGFNPLTRFPIKQIVPSEKDNYFRNTELRGYVHDMGAAMLGGVAGHAGLFSNAEDLGILMQMLLNGGSYGGIEYIKPETIKLFTTRYKDSTRRGLGFDMKELDPKKTENMAEEASDSTFGHLGFTGAAVWADPEYDLIFVFLANRTYPSMENNVFSKENYRPKAMSIVYKSMEEYTSKSVSAN